MLRTTSTDGTCVELDTCIHSSINGSSAPLAESLCGAHMSGNPHVLARVPVLCFTETCIIV